MRLAAFAIAWLFRAGAVADAPKAEGIAIEGRRQRPDRHGEKKGRPQERPSFRRRVTVQGDQLCTVSPWRLRSRPSTSTSLETLSPMTRSMTFRMMKLPTPQ